MLAFSHKKIYSYPDRKPQHKTQPQHTTTKMSGRRPPSGGFAPNASIGRGDLPPNHLATVPFRVCAGCEPPVLCLPAPVPLFGAPEWHTSKMREVGGALTLMAAIGFKNTTINQWSVSTLGNTSKKRRRWVGLCGEDIIPMFGVEN